MSRQRRLRWAISVATGAFAGVSIGLLVYADQPAVIAALPVLTAALGSFFFAMVKPPERGLIGMVLGLAFAVHLATAAALYAASVAIGKGGFITGDDAAYANLAWSYASYLRGEPLPPYIPPYWAGDGHLFGFWVYLESALFYVFGPNILIPALLNVTLTAIGTLFVHDMTRLVFGRRAAFLALVIVSFYPSLALWTSLTLREAPVLLFLTVTLWAAVRLSIVPGLGPMALGLAALVPLRSLRDFLAVGLAVLLPLAPALAQHWPRSTRRSWAIATAGASLTFLVLTQSGNNWFDPQTLLSGIETRREAGALLARTAFVEPPPLRVAEGETLEIAADATPSNPAVVHAQPGARIVVVRSTPPPSIGPNDVLVRPGDLVIVGDPGASPAAAAGRTIVRDTTTLTSRTDPQSAGGMVRRSLIHLPVGFVFALFAPFVWEFDRPIYFLLVPELILWYGILAAATMTVLRERAKWPQLAVPVLYVAGMLFLFAVAEGNWGTLVRHRTMVIPPLVALATPTFLLLADRLTRSLLTGPVPVSHREVDPA